MLRSRRLKCGTESNGGFRKLMITGNVIEGCKGFALESSDGAFLEDVAITGNTMRDIVDAPLFLRLNGRNRNPKDTVRAGTLRPVVISNLVSYNSASSSASILAGIASTLSEDVKLSNCYFGHSGLPKVMRVNWARPLSRCLTGEPSKCLREKTRPELLQFGVDAVERLLYSEPATFRDVARAGCDHES